MCGSSSGCDLTYRAAIQDMWCVFEGVWGLGGGEEGVEKLRLPTYRAETCSCIPTVLLAENIVVFDCTCNTQNSLLLNQHNGDDVPHNYKKPSKPPRRKSLTTPKQRL